MSDEALEHVQTEPAAVEQPTIEKADETINLNEVVEDQSEGEEQETEAEAAAVEEEPDPDFETIEVEVNGKKYQVPKGIKDGVLMQADYTKKTQETAEMRRQLEQRERELSQRFDASEQELNARAQMASIDQQLAAYKDVNWDRLEAEDPIGSSQHWRRFQQLEKAKTELSTFVTDQQRQRSEAAQQDTAKRLQETREFAQTKLKGWTEEIDAKVTQFATEELGFSRDTLLQAYNPAIYNALYLAWLGQQSLQKQQAAPKPAAAPVQPLRKVTATGSAPARKSLADMDMDEYVAARAAGRTR